MVLAVFLVSSSTMVAISALRYAYVESFDSETLIFGNFMAEYAHMKCIPNNPFCFRPQIFMQCGPTNRIESSKQLFNSRKALQKSIRIIYGSIDDSYVIILIISQQVFLSLSWPGTPILGLKLLSYAQFFVTFIALLYTQFQAITQVHLSSYSKNHNQCFYLAVLKGVFSSPSPESLLLHGCNLLLLRRKLEIPHGAHETPNAVFVHKSHNRMQPLHRADTGSSKGLPSDKGSHPRQHRRFVTCAWSLANGAL